MPVFNAIRPGFAFSQVFDTDAGAIPDGAALWLNLVRPERPSQVLVTEVTLVRESATRFRLDLTAGQTAPLREGMASGDFILRIGAVDTPLNWRVFIPVVNALGTAP